MSEMFDFKTEEEIIMERKNYKNLVGAVVACKWMDATKYDIDDIQSFLEHNKTFFPQNYIFTTFGELLAEDDYVILIGSTLADKNPYHKNRPGKDLNAIPKNCILDMKELEFKQEKKKGSSSQMVEK